MVVYQIYPRSFQDSSGDGVGDLRGVTQRLEHLAWLGVDALWLSPIHPSPMADGGYDVADYTTVDPAFGTDADADALIARAHALGLKVLLDVVPCHTSIAHAWFRDHPERYVWAPGGAAATGPPNNWAAAFGGPAWSRDPAGRGVYLHSFYPEQPDLDWHREDVRAAFAQILGGWRTRGVDGFRLDALQRLGKDAALRDDPPASAPPPLPVPPAVAALDLVHSGDAPGVTEAALEALREGAGADAVLVGEVYLPAARLPRYLRQLDAAFSFDLLFAPLEADALARAIRGGLDAGTMAWTGGNHDFSRPATRLGPDAARALALLLLFLPGVACVYQGDELGLPDGPGHPVSTDPPYDRNGRDPFRHPLPWTAEDAAHGFTTGTPWLPVVAPPEGPADVQRERAGSALRLHRDAIALRRELAGPVDALTAEDGVLRVRRGAHALVVNASARPLALTGEAVLVSGGDGRTLPARAAAVLAA
ncbi:alpha-amylase family glycosyl hydrolase [Paraconexibacter antarcticus]|uniref:Alpha-amylase family glycosyl hydrolase n=1 Tax=Paraconexibacter antarcticus TaxID=2949664 RepID=A0ABY5DYE3_9ACTN|nr:alpha-amylase family glycosyl hydrolase [Paraconexibacter antarcticus]UTI65954.1 alpha-amylase family glycosyl hydrolase [Paraconexibacter antarcticus]